MNLCVSMCVFTCISFVLLSCVLLYVRLSFDGVFSPPFPQPQKRKTRPHLAAKPGRDLAQEWPTRPEAGGCRVAQRERATHFLRPPRPAGGPGKLNRADRRELLTDSLQLATTAEHSR